MSGWDKRWTTAEELLLAIKKNVAGCMITCDSYDSSR
jgi:hypothetical protein